MRVTLRRILSTTDLSEASLQAVAHGVSLAREFQAQLLVCHCIDLPAPSIYGEAYLAPEEQVNHNIAYAEERLVEVMEGQGVAWEPLVVVGHAADEIAKLAKARGVDIVLTATRGYRGLKRMLLGSVTERLMRMLPCPLLIIPAAEDSAPRGMERALRFERILVGCDFSPDADLAFQHGLSLAQEFQAELHLVHVIETPLYTETLQPVFSHQPSSTTAIREFLQTKLEGLVPAEARHWCRPVITLDEGQPYARLLAYADRHAVDLIVLGVRGHGLIGTMLMGSTTDRVIRRAGCPVLSVCPRCRSG